jgi:hypothetical protein
MQKEAGENVTNEIAKGYELMLYKPLPAEKLKVFVDLYNEALNEFKADDDKTCEMIGVNSEHTNPTTAALVVVANAMMNLDEVVMKN